MSISGAQLVVRHLEAQGVRHIFGVPGAKIDRVYDALVDSPIQTVVCRHEQNAAFIAQGSKTTEPSQGGIAVKRSSDPSAET